MKVTRCLFCKSPNLTKITKRVDDIDILQCEKCSLMMVAETDGDSSLYDSSYFQKDSDSPIGYSNYLSAPVANLMGKYAFSRLLFNEEGGRHLDIGCADGSLIELFKSEGFNSRGLEISKDAVAVAREKGLDVCTSNLETFPKEFPKSQLITAFDLLEHVKNLSMVMKSIHDNLENNGVFCFSTLSVKNRDLSEYWFSHSLEHYIYFNKDNLSYILREVFGKNNFALFETEINGVAELWGFAKKGKSSIENERKIIRLFENESFDKKDFTKGYLFSLVYNQLAKSETSSKIIDHFKSKLPKSLLAQAVFYNEYYQGKFEAAISESAGSKFLIPARSVFWQTLSDAETRLFEIQKEQMQADFNSQIISLREQLFTTRGQLHALRNSRLVGRIIKARDNTMDLFKAAKKLPKKTLQKTKVVIAESTPDPLRKKIRTQLRRLTRQKPLEIVINNNVAWIKDTPLLSVITPFYNQDDTIAETVNSILSQTFTDFEYIIVDDGSKTEVEKFITEHLSDHRLRIIHHKTNLGKGSPAAARNTGVRTAKGKYVICLDADDSFEPTFLEKAVGILETDPDVSVVTSYMQTHGAMNEVYKHADFDPIKLQKDNMIITGAAYRKEAWEAAGGYKTDIGYEDWEYWINLSEHGYWGKTVHETLFKYFVAMRSRYIDDKDAHWAAIRTIRDLHPDYKKKIHKLQKQRAGISNVASVDTAFINIDQPDQYLTVGDKKKKNVLICMAWMTFGGAETLILNFCKELKDSYNLFFITGLKSENEWDYKFQEVSPYIYHLPNIMKDESLYNEYIANFITVHNISLVHILHTNFPFAGLQKIKQLKPSPKVIITMFNDRVPYYFQPSIDLEGFVDAYTSDNQFTANHFARELPKNKPVYTIPNGVDSFNTFNLSSYNRTDIRSELGLGEKELAAFFVGRLSEEKNPLVFLESAKALAKDNPLVKFFMIGDGPMDKDVKKKIKDINSDNIRYLGYQKDVARYLAGADVLVLPSSIEGFPLSILEAMSMQVAVIASNVGAIPDVIKDGSDGFIIKPGSANDINDILVKLNNDRNLLSSVKKNARKKVENKYSNLKLKKNYLKLYGDVLK